MIVALACSALLGDAPDAATFTWGGAARSRFESYSRRGFGLAGSERDDYVLQRVFLHADARADEHVRVFAELVSSSAFGAEVDKPPTQAGETDVQQAFVDWTIGDLTWRAGRMELTLGSARLVGVRDGTNVRLAFDGVRATWKEPGVELDALALRPVVAGSGSFDDASSGDESLWGLYATWTAEHATFDAYWLGRERAEATYASGTGRELRHSLGVRVAGERAHWDHDTEAVLQLGDFDGDSIVAWTIASSTGYTFADAPLAPRAGIKLDWASGDRDADDGELGTFDPLYPRNPYFSDAALFAPYNFVDVHPALALHPRDDVEVALAYDAFFRASTDDAVFSNGRVAIPAAASTHRHVGDTLELRASWKASSSIAFDLACVHFFAGDVVRDAGGRDTTFVAFWATWSF